ncbi:MAG: DUF4249 family protein [Prolixibacteraceae bacterium]|jgi:hypothetical protein|nr:DUF4249 family protein [Prolixibacteraceae bacterium]
MSYKIIIFLLLCFLVVACEEEVQLDLKDAEKQLVVEAILNNEMHALKVSLSYSQSFYSIPELKRNYNAIVEITGSDGYYEKLDVNENGVYLTKGLIPRENESYTLDVEVDEYQFSVTNKMPEKVEVKEVVFVPSPFWGVDSLNAFVMVDDPVDVDNYFRLFVRKAGKPRLVEYYLVDDSFGKNNVLSMPVYYRNFSPGDTVVVELRHLSKDTFDFYSTLNENINSSFNSIAPGNPVSNMPAGIMGHLSAYSVDIDTVIVPSNYK